MGKKSRIVILCESYASILYPLYLLATSKIDVPVTIFIPTLENLHHLFRVINEKVFHDNLELIYCPPYKQRWAETKGLKRLLYVIPDILRERRYLKRFYNEHFAKLKDADILFSSPGYSGAKIYILNKLRERNRIVFIDPGPPYITRYSPRSLRDIALLSIFKMIYGGSTQLGKFPADAPWSKGFPYISEKFMRNSIMETIDWSRRDEIMEDFEWERFRVFNTSDYRVIYFHQDLVDRDVPDREIFSQELRNIFKIILHYYPEKQIARKYHPAHELNKDVIGVGTEIPAYIPAEFLYNDKVELYIGISSYSIVNVRTSGKAVSIINLLSYKSEKLKEQGIEFLENASHKEILFPKSLEELEQILIDLGKSRLKSNETNHQ